MKNQEKTNQQDERALQEARRKYAEASVVARYEKLRQLTGMSGAERLKSLKINQNAN